MINLNYCILDIYEGEILALCMHHMTSRVTYQILMQLFFKLHFAWLIHLCLRQSNEHKQNKMFYSDIIIKTLQNDVSQENKTYSYTSIQIQKLH